MSSGVWAAMRDRRLLSARGHPDRLREKGERAKDRQRKRRTKKGDEESEGCEGIEKEKGERRE